MRRDLAASYARWMNQLEVRRGLDQMGIGLTAYERAGFRRVGVRRGAVMSRGRPTDIVIMDAVPEDFGASVLR